MKTTLEIRGTDICFHSDIDFGKNLNTGDYVILDQHYCRVFSKTYDWINDKWLVVIEVTIKDKED